MSACPSTSLQLGRKNTGPFRDPIALCRRDQRHAMHVLKAGFETRGRPCVLLLHGFPELAYLAQRDAGAGGSRLSRDRAGPARLWPHRLEIRLRWRSKSLPAAQSGARVRTVGSIPIGRADESAVRRALALR